VPENKISLVQRIQLKELVALMNYLDCQKYILGRPDAIESYPFGADVSVFKVRAKMFATLSITDDKARMNLKCDPDEANALRDVFDAVIPGYHMNKKHWNTVILDGSIPVSEIERMIDRSYGLVAKGLKKAERQVLELRYPHEQLYR